MTVKKTFLLIQWAVVGSIVALIAAFGMASTMGNWELRNILARWTVLSLQTAFILALCFGVLAWKDIRPALVAVSRRAWIVLGLLLYIGLILVAFVAPRTNRIYYDEQIYQNIAQNIAWTGKAYLCNEGNAEYGEYKPFATEYNKQPNGHPYFTSLFFRLMGVSELSAHIANYVALLLGAMAVFLTVVLLFKSSQAALFACAFYIGTPKVLQWSSSAAAEPSTAAFAALAMTAAALFLRAQSTVVLLLLTTLLAIAIQFRPESVFIIVPVALLILLSSPGELKRPRLYWAGLLFVLLALPMVLHMYVVRNENWGSSGDRMALSILWQNLPVNGPFYFLNEYFPVIFSVFALLGLLVVGQWREKAPVLLWFLLFWGFFLFFYAGSYEYGADVRFSLVSAAPLAIFAGLGAGWLAGRRIREWPSWTATALVAIVAFMLWIPFLPLIRSVGEEAVDARLDVEYAREMAKLLPVDSIVLAHDPCMWLMWGCNAAQLSAATENKGHVDNDFFARYKGGVYMHWGFWCNVPDPGQNQFGNNIKRDYDTELVKAYDKRGFHYALYRIYPKGREFQRNAATRIAPTDKPSPPMLPPGPYMVIPAQASDRGDR
ncbi:MAG: glycosyltransferase family 39 protein [Verrucomicrobia bacterium]|nr:glycosyltransferase family 39 protein [Verrucomicrobiota bacterium]